MENRIAITEDQLFASNKINRYIQKAINSWVDNNNTGGIIKDNSSHWYDKALKIAQIEANKKGFNVEFDYPGLYPTYEITNIENEKHYTEYNSASFFKRINGFWD